MTTHPKETDKHAAQLDLLGGILNPLEFAGNKSDPERRWEFNDGSESRYGATMRLHSKSVLDLAIVKTAFQNVGIEIAFAHKGSEKMLMMPEENFEHITSTNMTRLEEQISAQVMAIALNDGFKPQSDVTDKWHADAGKNGSKSANARVHTDSVLEAVNLSREMRDRTGLDAKIKHKAKPDGHGVQYMVVVDMTSTPAIQLRQLASRLKQEGQNRTVETPAPANRAAMGR